MNKEKMLLPPSPSELDRPIYPRGNAAGFQYEVKYTDASQDRQNRLDGRNPLIQYVSVVYDPNMGEIGGSRDVSKEGETELIKIGLTPTFGSPGKLYLRCIWRYGAGSALGKGHRGDLGGK